ncbi:ATPase/histidine kinase/DNA gyrase B/HSP90 domain protein [Clostridiales bacterium oral taxon 876 str. F0540]|nr:ATPase/histidine kinase/DNA gyrase B/HSP90 domain protein [Clostridiales bacterium oral taxon 876 str. F0540]
MGIKRKKNLGSIFASYIVYFILGTVALAAFYIIIFLFAMNNNVILPSNYFEKKIESSKDNIMKAEVVTKDIVPEGCDYGVYDEVGNMLYGTFNSKTAKTAWEVYKANEKSSLGSLYYTSILRSSQVCIVEYPLTAQFKNPLIRKYLGSPEVSLIAIFVLSFIGEVVFLSSKFARYFSKEMNVLMQSTEEIKRQNLDFEAKHSKIYEIEEVMKSIDDMKKALKASLEKQWNMEKSRKNQISALAHDIKTPLTIIKGNAELIKESCKDEDQEKYNEYILKSVDEIQHYLKVLMDITKSEDLLILRPSKISARVFVDNIMNKVKALTSEKELELINEEGSIPDFFYADEELLYRAIMNVITNAVEYSPISEKLIFRVQANDKKLEFIITDSGRGFSEEELEFATEQFYRGDKSRNSKNHYGMGLSITKTFIAMHKGSVELSNSLETGGAQVVLIIPLNKGI